MQSPLLDQADNAAAYFDRSKNQWATLVRVRNRVYVDRHQTQRIAREFVGLEGGSEDPYYQPPAGETGYEARRKIA